MMVIIVIVAIIMQLNIYYNTKLYCIQLSFCEFCALYSNNLAFNKKQYKTLRNKIKFNTGLRNLIYSRFVTNSLL
jgi:hypothetical protein